MTYEFWYVLIHAGLGILGYEVFTFTNLGGLYVALAAAAVQGYWIWTVHKFAWPRFEASRAAEPDAQKRKEMTSGYWSRFWKVYLFRISVFSLVTLGVAAVMRNQIEG